jgi:integrase
MGVYRREGKWEVRLQIRGVKYYRRVPEAQTKAQAQVAEASLRLEIFEGRYGKEAEEVGAHDFADFARRFYLPHKRDIVSALTYRHEGYKVKALCEHFAGKRLRDVSQLAIEGYRRKLLTTETQRKRVMSAHVARQYINTLSQILDYAIECELLGLNPCRKIKWARGSTASRRERVLTAEEEGRLLPLLDGEVRAAALLSLNTGMRRMSILRLRASDVDFARRVVTFTRKGGRRQSVPLNAAALSVLRELAGAATPEGHLFHNRRGHNLSATNAPFQRAVRAAKLGDFHFHDLRHTFATRLRSHTDAYTLRDVMGHAKADTTDIYVTTSLEDQRRAVESMGNVLQFHEGFTAGRKAG